jgi:hypothetical protein
MNIGSVAVGERAASFSTTPPAGGAGGPAASSAARCTPGATASPATGGVLGGLLRNVSQATLQRRAEQLGSILTSLTRSALGGGATGATGTASTAASSGGALAFLKDPKLSVEEKLARLMVHLSDKYEKQLEQKLQQYAALEGGTSSTKKSSTSSSSGGSSAVKQGLSALVSKAGLGKLLGDGTLQKLAGQLAGPVLAGAATALGLPALAPTLLKAGPLLASFASGAFSALSGEAGATAKGGSSTSKSATSSSKSSSSSGSSGSSSASGTSEKALMTEIQILQEKQKEMFTLVSNILRSQHDTKMAVIGNLR